MTGTRPARSVRALLVVGAGVLLAGCGAKLLVTKVPDSPGTGVRPLDGIVYALPKTVVKLDVPVELTVRRAGRFQDLADLFVPDEKVVGPTEKQPARALDLKAVAFSVGGEVDPENMYVVQATGRGTIDQSLLFDLTEEGAMTGTETQIDNQTTDIVLATLGATASIAGRVAFGAAVPGTTVVTRGTADEQKFEGEFLKDPDLVDNYRALSPPRRAALAKIYKDKDTADGQYQRLTDARAYYFKNVREYAATTAGLFDAPGLGLDVLLQQREKTLRENMSAFTGKSESKKWTGSFELRPARFAPSGWVAPKPDTPAAIEVMRINPEAGICSHADLRGKEPPPPEFLAAPSACAVARVVSLGFALDPPDQVLTRVVRNYTNPADPGLRYVVPAQVRMRVYSGETQVGEARAAIAQFGAVIAVPASLGGKAVAYNMKLYETTGALKQVKLASKPIFSKDVVSGAGSAATTLLDARAKQMEKQQAAEDRLTQLERQRKLLEDEAKIRELCALLGKDCSQILK